MGQDWAKNSSKGYFHTSHFISNPKNKFLKSHSFLTLSKLKDKLTGLHKTRQKFIFYWKWSFADGKKNMPSEKLTTIHTLKKQQTLWPLYGWGSTASRLEPLRRGSFLSLSFQKFLVLILWTSEGWKAELTLEPPGGFEHGVPVSGIQRLKL